jgi:hypothetical protein
VCGGLVGGEYAHDGAPGRKPSIWFY